MLSEAERAMRRRKAPGRAKAFEMIPLGCLFYVLSAVSSGARAPSLLEAIGAIQRLAARRLEWNLGLLATLVAHRRIHLARRAGPGAPVSAIRGGKVALVLARVPAIAAADGLVLEATTLIEFLFARSPHECISTVPAGDGFVLEAHRRSPL